MEIIGLAFFMVKNGPIISKQSKADYKGEKNK